MKRTIRLFAGLTVLFFCRGAAAQDGKQVNALLVIPSAQTAFDGKFQSFLDKKGAKLLQSYPPSVFVGYIPRALDAELAEKYGARVYRDRVEDWSSFARYGEKAVFAVNAWNKRFVEDPPEAPLVVSSRVRRAGKKGDTLDLTWNAVMKAVSYRLQIGPDPEFTAPQLDTMLARNSYRVVPSFWKDGVYYWRVAGRLRLNSGELRDGPFSEAYSFAVSNPARPRGAKLPAPPLPGRIGVTDRPLSWASAVAFKYYRLQISESGDFGAPLLDVFTDTCSYKLAGLGLLPQTPYYMRVMGSDGAASGGWSGISELSLEPQRRVTDSRNR